MRYAGKYVKIFGFIYNHIFAKGYRRPQNAMLKHWQDNADITAK